MAAFVVALAETCRLQSLNKLFFMFSLSDVSPLLSPLKAADRLDEAVAVVSNEVYAWRRICTSRYAC